MKYKIANEIFRDKMQKPQYAHYIGNIEAQKILYNDILKSLQFSNYVNDFNTTVYGRH